MVNPNELIKQIRDSDEYIASIYMNGGCYQFYKILKLIYPTAIGYKVKLYSDETQFNHVITFINGSYYDIEGEVDISNLSGIEVIKEEDIAKMEKWSFSKNNFLYKRCPHCTEEILF